MGFWVVGKFQVHRLLIKIALKIWPVGNVVKNQLNSTVSNISSTLTTFGGGGNVYMCVRLSFCVSDFIPLGWRDFEVIAQKWCLSEQTESSTSGWMARRPWTWPAANATPYRQTGLLRCWVQSEMFWFDSTHCNFIGRWAFACVHLMTAA